MGLGTVRSMDVEFTVSLVELKRAFRRLLARLPDEAEAGAEFVVFDASSDNLNVAARGTTEGLSVSVVHSGRARGQRPTANSRGTGFPCPCSSETKA